MLHRRLPVRHHRRVFAVVRVLVLVIVAKEKLGEGGGKGLMSRDNERNDSWQTAARDAIFFNTQPQKQSNKQRALLTLRAATTDFVGEFLLTAAEAMTLTVLASVHTFRR